MQPSKKRKKWKDMTPGQRVGVIIGAAVHLVLVTLAQRDLKNRPEENVRGPKWLWRIVTTVNFVGPLAYFCCGRKQNQEA